MGGRSAVNRQANKEAKYPVFIEFICFVSLIGRLRHERRPKLAYREPAEAAYRASGA